MWENNMTLEVYYFRDLGTVYNNIDNKWTAFHRESGIEIKELNTLDNAVQVLYDMDFNFAIFGDALSNRMDT
jgi:hypothetical protein